MLSTERRPPGTREPVIDEEPSGGVQGRGFQPSLARPRGERGDDPTKALTGPWAVFTSKAKRRTTPSPSTTVLMWPTRTLGERKVSSGMSSRSPARRERQHHRRLPLAQSPGEAAVGPRVVQLRIDDVDTQHRRVRVEDGRKQLRLNRPGPGPAAVLEHGSVVDGDHGHRAALRLRRDQVTSDETGVERQPF